MERPKFHKMRKRARMTQRQLAEITDISVRTLQGYEINGLNAAAVDRALRIADALGCDVRELVEDEWRKG